MAPLDIPPNDAVRKAVAQVKGELTPGERVSKVLYLDDKGESIGEWHSTQLPENPWDGIQSAGVQEPPFRLEQLQFLAEMHPIHSSALDQKTADVCGKGWAWEPENPDLADEEVKGELEDWFESLSPDDIDMREVIETLWLDVETTGWGLLECARDPSAVLRKVYNVPSHTVKAHRDGFRLLQARDSRKVWFKRWGATDINGQKIDVDMRTGAIGPEGSIAEDRRANDLFVVKRPSRRSTWYGIPGYVSSIGWVTLALAARDDNLWYFANRREPRWCIVLTGLGEDTELEEDLRRALTVDMRQPHRNLIIPVNSKDAKIEFNQLTGKGTTADGTFANLGERADKQIMVAHRVPAERLANSTVGALGGNVAAEANRVYKEGVIAPSQELLNSRLNRFVSIEHAIAHGGEAKPGQKAAWLIKMADLDIRSDREDLVTALMEYHGDIITLRETRHKLGYEPLMTYKEVPQVDDAGQPILDPVTGMPQMGPPDLTNLPVNENGDPLLPDEIESPYNDKLFTEIPGAAGQAGNAGGPPSSAKIPTDTVKSARFSSLEDEVREILRQSRETHSRLVGALADAA